MSCRSTPSGSAFTSYARIVNGNQLSDPACLSLFHELRRRYEGQPEDQRRTYTREDYVALLERQRGRVRRAPGLTDARRTSLLARLDEAERGEMPDQRTLYALHNITPQVRERATTLNSFLASTADRMGISVEAARTRFQELEAQAPRQRGAQDEAEYTDIRMGVAERAGLGREPGLVYAAGRLSEEADAVEITRARQAPQRIERQPFPLSNNTSGVDGLSIRSAGYDPRNGRLEVETVTSDGTTRVMAYHGVPETVGTAIANGNGSLWGSQVRGNADYAYANEHAAAIDGAAPRCASCGQFANTAHTCPIQAEPTRMNQWSTSSRWSRQAVLVRRYVREYDYNTRTYTQEEREVEDRILLPAIREFRTAVNNGPIRLSGVQSGGYEITPSVDASGQQTFRNAYRNTQGDITIYRDQQNNNALTVDMSRMHCTCATYRSHGTCPHVNAIETAIRQRIEPDPTSRARTARTPEEREAILREAQARAEQVADRTDWTRHADEAAEARANWRRDAEVLYSEDPAAFRADVEAAKARAAAKNGEPDIPYMTENALDGMARRGDGQAFGMEIEFEFPRSMSWSEMNAARQRIGQQLYDAGLTYDSRQLGYGASKRRGFRDSHTDENGVGNWSFENDGSVNGGELVTPGMYDEPETWQKLAKAVEIIKANGGVASTHAGAHVHVGTSGYSGNPAAYTELARLMTQHEDVMFRLASNPERGTHRRNSYAKGLPAVPAEGFSDISSAHRWQPGRYSSINFAGVRGDQTDHPEFRLFDSTLDPGAMQAQIKVAVAMTQAANRQAGSGGTARRRETWGSHAERASARGSRRRLTDEEFDADSATTRSLLDTLFRRREDKAQLAAVFAHTKWSKSR